MVAGDIVNISMSASTTYQPAAGIELVLIKVMNGGATMGYGFTNGVVTTEADVGTYFATDGAQLGDKVGITNTQYYISTGINVRKGFSAMQIK